MDKGFESIRGTQLSKDKDGTSVYVVTGQGKFNMRAESQFIFIREDSPMGYYFANYGIDTSITNSSFKAFLGLGDPWPEYATSKNPMTIVKDVEASKNGKLVYFLYTTGLKIGIYTLDEKTGAGVLIIGFI